MKQYYRKIVALFAIIAWTNALTAASVDTVLTYSPSMKKNIKAVVIKPNSYSATTPLPVVYLLHGYSDNQSKWINTVPTIKDYADQNNLIIVCPDGNFGSWYFDSPVDSSWKYETYISKELVSWIDGHFNTIKDRKGRGITGLSMGGHGGLYLGFRHQDVFGTAGSMSGGVDLTPFPNNWNLADRLGLYAQYPERWRNNSVINLTNLLTPNALAIIIDCGVDDFFYKANVALHDKLVYSNIPHDFISRPGGHSWDYWTNAIGYQLLFMHNYFNSAAKKN